MESKFENVALYDVFFFRLYIGQEKLERLRVDLKWETIEDKSRAGQERSVLPSASVLLLTFTLAKNNEV
jgi:hypothetical protein